MKKEILFKIIIFAALMGLLISSYLTYSYYSHNSVVCVLGEKSTCNNVLNSKYSSLFFGLPNSLIGGLLFLALVVLSYLGIKNKKVNKPIFYLSLAAFLFDLMLAYITFFVIDSFCIWCFATWILIIIILMCSVLLKVIK